MFNQPRAKFGEVTPPAIFPPIMGLFGLGLAWRSAERVFELPPVLSQMLLGAVSLLYAFALVAYLRKFSRRPSVVLDDLKVLPGRAGLAAGVLSLYLLAAALVPLNPGLAKLLLFSCSIVHAALMAAAIHVLVSGPPEQRQVTPAWHLLFVGPILSPLSAVPLGYQTAAYFTLIFMALIALLIWAVSVKQLITHSPPAPLRPMLAIHLAPASVLGTVAVLLELQLPSLVLAGLALLILALLLGFARYITQNGFSPLWGAFTFPLAAFANFMFMLDAAGQGAVFAPIGIVALVAASAMIPVIALKVMQLWIQGRLAAKTNAARA